MYLNFSQRFTMLFAWVVFIIVLLLSPMPISNAPESVTFVDKIVHAFLFGILAFLTFYLLKEDKIEVVINPEREMEVPKITMAKKKSYLQINDLLKMFLIIFFTSTSLAIILEYVQAYVPGRSSDKYDLLAGVIGIILVLIFIYGDNYNKKEA